MGYDNGDAFYDRDGCSDCVFGGGDSDDNDDHNDDHDDDHDDDQGDDHDNDHEQINIILENLICCLFLLYIF